MTIDLKKEYFTPGKKNYEHTRAALEKRFNKKFDVIVAWDPPEEKVCPSSIAAWFHKHGYKVSLCRQTFFQRTQYSLQIPIISNGCDIEAFLEWLGIFCISGDLCNGNEDNFVNMYQCPSPFMQVGQVQYLQWSGFFTRKKVAKVYDAMKKYVSLKDTLPWCALHVQGFSDSLVSWDIKEHTFFMDGDNSYTTLFQPAAETIIRKSLSSNNKPRIFQ